MRLLRANCRSQQTSPSPSTELSTFLCLTKNLLKLTRPRSSLETDGTSNSGTDTTPATGRRVKAASSTPEPSKQQQHQQQHQNGPKPPPQLQAGSCLPWCGSPFNRSTMRTARVVRHLSKRPNSVLLIIATTRYLDSSQMRHLATQPLLLNALRLALTPGVRPDLQPLWFSFLLETLPHWGAATAYMIHCVLRRLSASLHILAAPFFQPSSSSSVSSPVSYPPDYSLQVLACLQGITHAFLLPFGQSKTSLVRGMAAGAAAVVSAASDWSSTMMASAGAGGGLGSHHRGGSSLSPPVNRALPAGTSSTISKGILLLIV